MNLSSVYELLTKEDREIIISSYIHWRLDAFTIHKRINGEIYTKNKDHLKPTHATLIFYDMKEIRFILINELDEVHCLYAEWEHDRNITKEVNKIAKLEHIIILMTKALT